MVEQSWKVELDAGLGKGEALAEDILVFAPPLAVERLVGSAAGAAEMQAQQQQRREQDVTAGKQVSLVEFASFNAETETERRQLTSWRELQPKCRQLVPPLNS